MTALKKIKEDYSGSEQFSLAGLINDQNKSLIFLTILLVLSCFYDLISGPYSTTMWRQAQTAMITDNYVREGFSLQGLYVGLKGNEKLMMAYEFPVYNFIVGLLFKVFNHNPFWGKLLSLVASIVTLIFFYRLVKSISNNSMAFYASLFFVLLPIDVLMFAAFQPDALGVMFMMISLFILNKWRGTFSINLIIGFSVTLLLAGLCKFPILIPYMPIAILMYFFPTGKFRFPTIVELAIIAALFLIPFVSWYLYRVNLTDPVLLSKGFERKLFFIGDLSRFLSPGFYVKPAMMLTLMVCCGTGTIYFLSGLRKISGVELALLVGIPLYYIIIPTVADQNYYLYYITPIVALFMAKGAHNTASYLKKHQLAFIHYILTASFVFFSFFGINHVLRMDGVMEPLSGAVQQSTQPKDLVFVVPMHDRSMWVGGYNPSVVYCIKRNGWNIQHFQPGNFKNTIEEINSKRDEGAKWLVITWYTEDLEPWYYFPFLPKEFTRKPAFDSKAIADELKQQYPVHSSGNNFAILKLEKGS